MSPFFPPFFPGDPEYADRAETMKLRLLVRMLELDDRSAAADPRDRRP